MILPEISTHAPRTGSDKRRAEGLPTEWISTHAPRTGSDPRTGRRRRRRDEISTHAPRTGSDHSAQHQGNDTQQFQPTLPARGATSSIRYFCCKTMNFNPRSPHGERRWTALRCSRRSCISTHAPRTGSDRSRPCKSATQRHFNPRSPHGERRCREREQNKHPCISTHAPRTGSDIKARAKRLTEDISTHAPRTGSDQRIRNVIRCTVYFNPRSPHGERREHHALDSVPGYFNPRSPHGERRVLTTREENPFLDFNPRSPHGERHRQRRCGEHRTGISTHAPRTGSDGANSHAAGRDAAISTHAPRTGSDRRPAPGESFRRDFNPRSPHGERRRRFRSISSHRQFQPTLPARGATRRRLPKRRAG